MRSKGFLCSGRVILSTLVTDSHDFCRGIPGISAGETDRVCTEKGHACKTVASRNITGLCEVGRQHFSVLLVEVQRNTYPCVHLLLNTRFYAPGGRTGSPFPFSSIIKTSDVLKPFLFVGKCENRYPLFFDCQLLFLVHC